MPLSLSFKRKAPNLALRPPFIMADLRVFIMPSPVPSIALRTAFPVKPSATTTSAAPDMISRASTLPTKLILDSLDRSSKASLRRLSPFVFSVPLLRRPTRGLAIPRTFLA